MNVLIFVMTMLMLLAMLAYGRLETYVNSQLTQVVFENYMQNQERSSINSGAVKAYDDIKKSGKTKDTPPTPRVKATSKITMALFFNHSLREKDPKQWNQSKILLKNLIVTLYGQEKFFKEALEKRPGVVDELISAIEHASDALPPDKKMKQTKDLLTLKLQDPVLDDLFYQILKENPYIDLLPQSQQKANGTLKPVEPVEEENKEDHADGSEEAQEHQSPPGYFSLLDFINNSKDYKVRVFLAPKQVLQAIFRDQSTVDEIMREREMFYKQAVSGMPVDELSKAFESRFNGSRQSDIDTTSLDYSVSKTRPKK